MLDEGLDLGRLLAARRALRNFAYPLFDFGGRPSHFVRMTVFKGPAEPGDGDDVRTAPGQPQQSAAVASDDERDSAVGDGRPAELGAFQMELLTMEGDWIASQ